MIPIILVLDLTYLSITDIYKAKTHQFPTNSYRHFYFLVIQYLSDF